MAEAADAVDVAAFLVEGSEANVKRAERGLINDDTAVADLIRDVLNDDLFSGQLPIKVVTVPADVVKPDVIGSPVLYVVQQRPSKNSDGALSANLMVHYCRPSLYAPLDGEKLAEACRERHYGVHVGAWSSVDHGDYVEDPFEVRVMRAIPRVPVLAVEPSDVDMQMYANVVRNRLLHAVSYFGEGEGIRLMGEPTEGRAQVNIVSHRVVSHSPGRGNRRMTVEMVHAVHPDAMWVGAPVAEMVRGAIHQEVGNIAASVGRVVAIDDVKVKVTEMPSNRYADPEPYIVTAQFGVTYRLA
ncbi:hypothetical protein [Blastococcus sp. SYSU DS0973]